MHKLARLQDRGDQYVNARWQIYKVETPTYICDVVNITTSTSQHVPFIFSFLYLIQNYLKKRTYGGVL
jgi:hypothetical protein